MLTATAVNHGFSAVKNPNTAAATKIINTEIPVSSQFGRESIHAIAAPAMIAGISKITEDFFMPV